MGKPFLIGNAPVGGNSGFNFRFPQFPGLAPVEHGEIDGYSFIWLCVAD
jgi:hypothetical protein